MNYYIEFHCYNNANANDNHNVNELNKKDANDNVDERKDVGYG